MPLSANALTTRLVQRLDSEFPPSRPERNIDKVDRQKFCKAIANAVVEELRSNALVTGFCPSSGGPLANGKVV